MISVPPMVIITQTKRKIMVIDNSYIPHIYKCIVIKSGIIILILSVATLCFKMTVPHIDGFCVPQFNIGFYLWPQIGNCIYMGVTMCGHI